MRIARVCIAAAMIAILLFGVALAVEYPEGTLHRGIYGHEEEVEFLQYQLFYAGYLGDDIDSVDGIFGKNTEAAVKAFQRDYGVDVTGIVCPNTQMKLDEVWEAGMEAQGGQPFCWAQYDEMGTKYMYLCDAHLLMYNETAVRLADSMASDAQTILALQANIAVWQEEIGRLHQQWLSAYPPEEAKLIRTVQQAHLDCLSAQIALWNAQYGENAMPTLDLTAQMLYDYCVQICCVIGSIV